MIPQDVQAVIDIHLTKQDEPTNSNALTKARHCLWCNVLSTRLVNDKNKRTLAKDKSVKNSCQRRLLATHVNDSLCYATLRYAALRYATLRYAALCYATLRYAALRYATLRYATLYYATSMLR